MSRDRGGVTPPPSSPPRSGTYGRCGRVRFDATMMFVALSAVGITFSLRPKGKEGAHESANITEEGTMKRSLSPFVLVVLAFVAAFMLEGCGRESSSAEREERQEPSAE